MSIAWRYEFAKHLYNLIKLSGCESYKHTAIDNVRFVMGMALVSGSIESPLSLAYRCAVIYKRNWGRNK